MSQKQARTVGLVAAAVLFVPFMTQCSSEPEKKETPATAETSASPSATQETTKAESAPVAAPTVIPLAIPFAEEKNGITVDAVDIGEQIVDGVDRQRGIFDPGNWRIVAQCDLMVDNTLKAGVIKADEFQAISQAGQARSISDNTFKSLLDCPA